MKPTKNDTVFILGAVFISYLYVDSLEENSLLWSFPLFLLMLTAFHKAGKMGILLARRYKDQRKMKRLFVKV